MKTMITFHIEEKYLEIAREILGRDNLILNTDEGMPEALLVKDNSFRMYNTVKFIQTINAGTDNIDMASIPENVIVASNAGAYSIPVAEHAFALILERIKKISKFSSETRSGLFRPSETRPLYGKTIGIIGYGGIGSRVAHIAKSFGMNVIAIGRGYRDQNCDIFMGIESINELFSRSDYILISIPLTALTVNLIKKEQLALVKQNSIIVNVARAEIVKMNDMLEFLKSRSDVSYLTDVWWGEPNLTNTDLDNVVVTPHVAGGLSDEFKEIAFREAFNNIKIYAEGKRPKNIVKRNESVYFQRSKMNL
ncbi:MAG: 2-hydroxyacid dehydrogenase [Thermoplasmatales archaeon]